MKRTVLVMLLALLGTLLPPVVGAHAEPPDCQDAIDNDGDGLTDYPDDPGCMEPEDDNETNPPCSDGIDNDEDGYTDYPDDAECDSARDLSEVPECSDAIDNDADGLIDFPEDPHCAATSDDLEGIGGDGFESAITIRYQRDRNRFTGVVVESNTICLARRRVRLMSARQGPDRLVGRDRTGPRGRWAVYKRRPRGRFYAVVRREIRPSGQRDVLCQRDRSVTIRVGRR